MVSCGQVYNNTRHDMDIAAFQQAAGRWWKFERYTVRDGYICAAPKAKLREYDPWHDYSVGMEKAQKKSGGRNAQPPYQSLLDLVNKWYEQDPSATMYPTPKLESEIAEWCSVNGLLGLLTHQASTVTLAARWRRDQRRQYQNKRLVPEARRFTRTADGWELATVIWDNPGLSADEHKEPAEQIVPTNSLPTSYSVGTVLMRRFVEDDELTRIPLAEGWGRYFPSVPQHQKSTFDYPVPMSAGFWRLYAERSRDFMRAAGQLALAARLVVEDRDSPEFETGRLSLNNRLMTDVRPYLTQSRELSFSSPSLLASLATMISLDVQQGRLFKCAVCKRLSVSTAWQAEYCSPRCRNTALKRRYRAKKLKEKKGKHHVKKKRKL